MAFTASTMNRVNVNLARMFTNPLTNSDNNVPAMTAKAILNNQTAMADPVLEGGICVGVKAYYISTVNIGTVSAPSDCTTPGGNQADTLSKNYTSAPYAHSAGSAIDSRCDNEVSFIEESTRVLAKLIANTRKQLNVKIIQTLDTNSGVNIFTEANEIFDLTASSPRIEVPSTAMTWDNLGYFNVLAENNNFTAPIMISGASNFWGEWWKSNYQRFNNNEAGIYQAFADQNFYFDTRDLDQTVGRKTTFAVDRNSYIFWNTTFSTPTPTEFSFGSNGKKWVWTIADPELTYSKNGTQVPVLYELEVEEACSSRNTLSQLVKTYKYYVRCVGGFEMAPVGAFSETGVLQFTGVAGV